MKKTYKTPDIAVVELCKDAIMDMITASVQSYDLNGTEDDFVQYSKGVFGLDVEDPSSDWLRRTRK